MEIDIAKQQAERIGVLSLLYCIRPEDPQPIGYAFLNKTFEQTGFSGVFERSKHCAVRLPKRIYFASARQKCSNDAPVRAVVRPEHRERIVVAPKGDGTSGLFVKPPRGPQMGVSHDGLPRHSR